jgi:predicted lysophospholipase L1 biosynthesis ABC-type transport system permease subunit
VSENLARELWNQPSAAIGKRVRPYPKSVFREVVGVFSDTRDDGVNQKSPGVAYWPLLMLDFAPVSDARTFVQRSAAYMIRSSRAGSSGLVSELSQAVWSINPNLPLASVRTLQEIYDGSLARTSFTLVMLGIAGGMALLLGVAGIYGVIAYSVAQRTREIGIRIALGAQAQRVRRMFVAHGLTLAGVGVAIGLTAALATMRVMSSLLFEMSPADPLTYATVLLTIVAATCLASYVPAQRATAVDPIEALRSE